MKIIDNRIKAFLIDYLLKNDIEINHCTGCFLAVFRRIGKNPSPVEENTPFIDFY
jgi:hypothetical protein